MRIRSARRYHFAGPGNYYGHLMHEASFTPVQYTPEQQHKLLEHGIGITNIVARPTRGETDITWEELQQGAGALHRRLQNIRSEERRVGKERRYKEWTKHTKNKGCK